ncbi:MAG: YeeE/YedE thiosulfate transporter family protein [Eubacteriales bacterium]|nr:YeeE/YedE thiosulfate transporter family protein [Eubacteriales bacterium]
MSETQAGSSIQRRSASSRSSTARKPKPNQLPFAILTLIALILAGLFLQSQGNNMGWYLVTGLIFGYILQRSRFCFTASMRDPFLTGSTILTRAVLAAFAMTTIAFAAIKYGYFKNGLPVPGMNYVVPISLATVIGAFMFGVGMVIAGGCGSGTMMRVGEGFYMQMLSLAFFVIGNFWGAHDFGWWKENVINHGKAIFLPDVFGWFGAVVIQLVVIWLIYIAAEKFHEAKAAAGSSAH